VTEEQTDVQDEPIQGFVREEEDKADATETPAVEAPPIEVVEGKVVEEEIAELAKEATLISEEEEVELDELTVLSQQLEAAQAQADEYLDDLRRERAAFQNYKKRQENERAELRQAAIVSLLIQILPVLDDLERALNSVPEDQSGQPWIEGIVLIQRKLHTALDAIGVVPVEADPGQPFDPFVHDAVTYEEDDNHQEGEIIAVVQKGYKLNQRTIRPAMVRVAR
jgi:molecular chaperone GrpE